MHKPRAFSLLLGFPEQLCSGVFFAENAHEGCGVGRWTTPIGKMLYPRRIPLYERLVDRIYALGIKNLRWGDSMQDSVCGAKTKGLHRMSMSSTTVPEFAPGAGSDTTGNGLRFGFENTYARLPEHFYARVKPAPVASSAAGEGERGTGEEAGARAGGVASAEGVEVLAGNRVAEGSEPLAMAYAGHQFGHFVPQLGDGRTNLLGEVRGTDGVLYDIQLKGSGPTPFSRRGDGRAALGPVLREYIVSEAMAALGVPSTRALAAVTTGEQVLRESVLPGAVLTRVAASHLRVGTFQYFAARGDVEGVRALADYAIARHYPEAAQSERPYRALLERVIAQAGAAGRAVDAAGVYPRRDEYRQYLHLRRDDRLRAVRVYGGL